MSALIPSNVPDADIVRSLMHVFRRNAHRPGVDHAALTIPCMPKPYGQKRHFTPEQLQTLARHLEDTKQFRDLTLLCLAVDTMLRSVDLLGLQVKDVCDPKGRLVDQFFCHQQKTSRAVEVAVLPYSQTAANCWIASKKLKARDFLFPGKGGADKSLTTSQFRRIVKGWAEFLELNPVHYACHSLRRTKPAFMHAASVSPGNLQFLLGHKSLQSTQEYLGLDRKAALVLARQFDIFNHEVE